MAGDPAQTAIGIAPVPGSAPGPTFNVKVLQAIDANGNVVEIQAVALADGLGRIFEQPLTEATGREIVDLLRKIQNQLFLATGYGEHLGD